MRLIERGVDPLNARSLFFKRLQKGRVTPVRSLAHSLVTNAMTTAVRRGSQYLNPEAIKKAAEDYNRAKRFTVFSNSSSAGLLNMRMKMQNKLFVSEELLNGGLEDIINKGKEREASKSKFEELSRAVQNHYLGMKQTACNFRETLHHAMFLREYGDKDGRVPRSGTKKYIPRFRWNTATPPLHKPKIDKRPKQQQISFGSPVVGARKRAGMLS